MHKIKTRSFKRKATSSRLTGTLGRTTRTMVKGTKRERKKLLWWLMERLDECRQTNEMGGGLAKLLRCGYQRLRQFIENPNERHIKAPVVERRGGGGKKLNNLISNISGRKKAII